MVRDRQDRRRDGADQSAVSARRARLPGPALGERRLDNAARSAAGHPDDQGLVPGPARRAGDRPGRPRRRRVPLLGAGRKPVRRAAYRAAAPARRRGDPVHVGDDQLAQGRAGHARELHLRQRGRVQADAAGAGGPAAHHASALSRERAVLLVHNRTERGRERGADAAVQRVRGSWRSPGATAAR